MAGAGLTLSKHPGLAQLRVVPFALFELGHRDRSILAIALGRFVIGEASADDVQRVSDHGRVLARKRPTEGRDDCVQSLRRMLDAVDQVMGVLAFEALVERECLQAP